MHQRQRDIHLKVELDAANVPEAIHWRATDGPAEEAERCEAVLLSLWDGERRETLRIDLWTKAMQVDHMNLFVYQTLATLADTFERATNNGEVADELREFAKHFAHRVELPPRA